MEPSKIIETLKQSGNIPFNEDNYKQLHNDLVFSKQLTKHHINIKILKPTLEKWLDQNRLILQNADKNLQLTLIDKDIYQTFLDKTTSDTNCYQQVPIEQAVKIIELIQISIQNLYTKFHRTKIYDKHIRKHNKFGIPNLYLIPKIHKAKLAFRPIVNQRNFIFTEIFKDVHNHFHNKLKNDPQKHLCVLDGNLDLLLKIDTLNQTIIDNNIDLNDYNIISLDVVNLYGAIDLNSIVEIIDQQTNYSNNNDYFYNNLIKIILSNNYIESQGKIYHQLNGLAMGINYAPSLANFYMFYKYDLFFLNLLRTNDKPHKPLLFYTRYLDDILVIYHTKINLPQTVNNIINQDNNRFNPSSIQFTIEHANNTNSINFLDLTITLDTTLNQLTYRNYEKANKVNMMLHFKAHYKAKAGLIKSQSIRIMKNSSTEHNYNTDMVKLTKDLMTRGYPLTLIQSNILPYSERPKYLKPPELNNDRGEAFRELTKDRKLIIIDDHDKTNIVRAHIKKVVPNALFIHKNLSNLYTFFFKNTKNTRYHWIHPQINKKLNNNNKPKHYIQKPPRKEFNQQFIDQFFKKK